MRTKYFVFLSVLPMLALGADPVPFGPLPSERQLRWHETETFSLIHFGMNTLTDREWGYGEVPPETFNPVKLDAGQVVAALKRGGMHGVILVAKHHDGFCLWPTKATPYNISKAPWRGGKGDLVRDYADAAQKHEIKFGVYCSPWDRNNPDYGKPEYVKVYQQQISELLSNYGTVFEMWFDGANGGDGYYGGAREKRTIDAASYYDWMNTWGIVRKLQPMASIFGDVGPDCRWVGNERGYAAEECWATFTPKGLKNIDRPANGDTLNDKEGPGGNRDGKYWMAPECDVPLRRGWFWHAGDAGTVKKPAQLMDIYFHSVGKGGCMNLGIAPDKDGLVCDEDIQSLDAFGAALNALFAENLADGAKAEADKTRVAPKDDAARYSPANVLDADRYSYWATEDGVTNATLTLNLGATKEFDVVRLRENIKLGQRVDGFRVEAWQNGEWRLFGEGKAIGACRLLRGVKIKTDRVRLSILSSAACPCISDFALFAMPANQD